MKDLYYRFLKIFSRIENNIAFYPSLVSLAGLIFAFLMYYAESKGISGYLVDNAPLLVVDDIETARTILSVFIGGLISIMVFSFSMVMILLNNASSNFSPRVLPGLISNRRHQIFLGIFNSTLLYCIFTLVAIEPTGNKYQLPGFSVLLAIVGMILSLGAFIYFIHSISQEIQVNNIMQKIYNNGEERLLEIIKRENKNGNVQFEDSSGYYEVESAGSGYFQDIAENAILKFARDNDVKIIVEPIKGTYVHKGEILYKTNKKLDSDETSKLCSHFVFSNNELVEDNYVLAFKQITEVAIKAMSPGINDPGTAVIALDYLSDLFRLRIKKDDESYYFNENEPVVKIKTADFKVILYSVLASLRTYATHDIIMANKMLSMLEIILKSDDFKREEYKLAVLSEIQNLQQEVQQKIKNKRDLEFFEDKIEALNKFIDRSNSSTNSKF